MALNAFRPYIVLVFLPLNIVYLAALRKILLLSSGLSFQYPKILGLSWMTLGNLSSMFCLNQVAASFHALCVYVQFSFLVSFTKTASGVCVFAL